MEQNGLKKMHMVFGLDFRSGKEEEESELWQSAGSASSAR
jgi:hypothetical protein